MAGKRLKSVFSDHYHQIYFKPGVCIYCVGLGLPKEFDFGARWINLDALMYKNNENGDF